LWDTSDCSIADLKRGAASEAGVDSQKSWSRQGEISEDCYREESHGEEGCREEDHREEGVQAGCEVGEGVNGRARCESLSFSTT